MKDGAKVGRLESALAPFVRFLRVWEAAHGPAGTSGPDPVVAYADASRPGDRRSTLRLSDLVAARRALAAVEDATDGPDVPEGFP